MKRFNFRLDMLLRLRQRAEDSVKQKLGKKNGEIADAQNQFAYAHDSLLQMQAAEKAKRPDIHDVMTLRYSVAYRHKLKHDMLLKAQEIEKLSVEAELIRQELVEATRKRKAIELLKERRFSEWKKEYRIEEQGFIDDVSQQSYIRKSQASKEK